VINQDILQTGFVILAFVIQVMLVGSFAARNWKPSIEEKLGWLVYGMGLPASVLGVLFLVNDQPWYYWTATLLFTVWAAFGYMVDVVLRVKWRNPPRWPIFIPYVVLFVSSLLAFWVPLWFIRPVLWIIYALLYAAHTALNMYSHFKPRKGPRSGITRPISLEIS
jgi:hypothetical protein